MSDWIDDLARLAEAATSGDWEVRRDSGCSWIAASSDEDPTVIADYLTVADAEFIAAANPAAILRLIEDNRRLTHLLGSHVDGHRCSCTMTRPAQFTHEYGPEPAEWEQDPWCPTHPEMSHVRAEYDALAARLAAVEAAFENLPIFLSAIEKDQRRTPKGRGGEAHFIPATPGHGKSGCPGDNITRWLNEVRAALSAAPTDTAKEN